jgi:uncharacterized lipoprotein YmbA
MMRSFVIGTATLCLALVTTGCSRSPRVTFYTLAPEIKVEAPVPERSVPAVAVGPVTLPEVVDRPQLVVRVAANQVAILESHRWAEPLKSEIPRLIAQNLGGLLGSNRVSYYQQHSGAGADYRVLLDIVRLESVPGEAVTIESAWTIRRTAGGTPMTGRSVVREKVEGAGYDALVLACSRALAGVSGDLAKAIRAEEAAAR